MSEVGTRPHSGVFSSLQRRLRGRPDSEHEQALLRIVLGVLVFFALLGVAAAKGKLFASEIQGLAVIVPFLFAAVGIFVWILVDPRISHPRRILGIFTDLGATTACLLMSGEVAAGIFCLYLWVTFGNGFRFGKPYLTATHLASFVGFTTVVIFNSYWQEHKTFAFSMLIALAILPLYVGTLLERITEARRRAEDANAAKSRFIANMSHELRTPIAGISGINELLLGTALTAEQQELLHTQTASTRALLDLIDSILDLSKIEAGRIQIENTEFDLYQVVNDVVRMFRYRAEQKGLTFWAHISPTVPWGLLGDPKRLRQILINLIGNAIKFTETGSVELNVTQVDGDERNAKLRFEVTDTGKDIAKEAQQRIFERFAQEDESTARRYGGTGLGTTIAKQLVELMRGRIGVKSEPGSGSTFWFELPLALRESVQISTRPPTLEQMRVLAVGTDALELRRVEEFVRSWNGVASAEKTPAGAFGAVKAAAEAQRPYHALVVLSDGLDVDLSNFAAGLGTLELNPAPTMVLAGNNIDVVTRAHLLQQGYAGFLRTPIDKTLLFNALHGACLAFAPQRPGIVALAERLRSKPKSQRALRILLAEDNLTNQKVIEAALRSAGHEVVVVSGGEAALDLIQAQAFDIAVVDMNMPEVSGLDIIARTRAILLDRRDLPFVVLTANATTDAKQECLAVGANAFLTKPVAFSELLETVDRIGAARAAPRARGAAAAAPKYQRTHSIVLDAASLHDLEQISSRPGFVSEALAIFLNENGKLVEEVAEALPQGRYQYVRDIAHSIKGNASTVGALAVAEVATWINKATQKDLASDGSKMVEGLQAAFSEARREIERYRGSA